MELVPILSTIILVGTIATFILAVAAYILYKIRERRAREATHQQTYMQAAEPHVLVAPEAGMQIQQGHPAQAQMYAQPAVGQPAPPQQQQQQQLQPAQQSPNSLFWEYTDEGFVPVNPQEAPRAQAEPEPQPRQQAQQDEGYAWL